MLQRLGSGVFGNGKADGIRVKGDGRVKVVLIGRFPFENE